MKKNRILQITDTHLFASAEGELMGVRSRDTLDAILELIKKEYNDFSSLLVTGDLTQDGSIESYQYLKNALQPFNRPCHWLCGNHDDAATMQQVYPEALGKRLITDNWQILLLNSQVPDSTHGHLDDQELAFLDKTLGQYPDLPTLIAFHHHPAPVESKWMDKIAIDNPKDLEGVVHKHPNAKAIIHGHVHQDCHYEFADIPVMATPSTCLQFAAHSNDFQVALSLPGFRILDLLPDGRFETQVIRLTDFPLNINQSLNGY